MEDIKNKEIESVKALISILAKKGYILKSELECILRGCRNNSFILGDLEKLMYACAENVDYIDDGVDGIVRMGLEIYKKIILLGYEDLYQYLEIESDASDEEILTTLKKRKERYCEADIECLIENNGRQTYEAILRSKDILEEMQLRRSFNVLSLKNSEYCRYLNEIVLAAFVDKATAKSLLDVFVSDMGFVVERDVDKEMFQKETLDNSFIKEQDRKKLSDKMEYNRQ